MHAQWLFVRSHDVRRQLKVEPVVHLELRDGAPEEHPGGIIIDLVVDDAIELGTEEVDIAVQVPPLCHLALGYHLHAEVVGLAEVDGHTVEHPIVLVGVVTDHIGAMAIIGREVEARLVPEMDVTQLIAVHIGRRQGRVAHADVAVVVVRTEGAHLPEARTTDTARVAHLELVELVHRLVEVCTREKVDEGLPAVDGVGAVVGIAFQVGHDVGHLGAKAHLTRPAAPFVAEAGIQGRHLLTILVVVAVVGQRMINAKTVFFCHFRDAIDIAIGVFRADLPLRLLHEGMKMPARRTSASRASS